MKKLILIPAFCIFAANVTNAQITLNSTDIAGAFKIVYNAIDTLAPSSIVGFSGASQVWNMTALTDDQIDTLTFLPYSAAPNPQFSSSNLIMKQGYQNNYVYAVNTSGSLSMLGLTGSFGGSPLTQKNTPAELLMNFPATYNTNFINNYVNVSVAYYGQDPGIGFVVDSFRVRSYVKKTVLVDAWGNLTTPYSGSAFPVLRIKETKVTHDTTDAFFAGSWVEGVVNGADSTTKYAWWANSVGFSLATATMDSAGNVTQVEWLKNIFTGIGEHEIPVGVNVYPNPAQNEIHFTINTPKEAKLVQLFDITGRMIHEYKLKHDWLTINTSHFANGIYTYAILGEDKAILNQGKFTVAK